MRARIVLIALAALVFLGSFLARHFLDREDRTAPAGPPQRLVSLSPSTTETLFALGLGDRVVGVSRYCKTPPEAQTRTVVGGYLDPNYEAVLALQPDLVLLRGDNEQYVAAFDRLGLRTLVVHQESVEGINQSILAIGEACGAADEARRLAADLREQFRLLKEKTAGRPKPRALLVIDRSHRTGQIQNAFVAGGKGLLNELIVLAGGENACPPMPAINPVVSLEGILSMKPEVVIELTAVAQEAGLQPEEVLADWRPLRDIPAVRNGRVHVLSDNFVPGPRIAALAGKLARLFHPDAFP